MTKKNPDKKRSYPQKRSSPVSLSTITEENKENLLSLLIDGVPMYKAVTHTDTVPLAHVKKLLATDPDFAKRVLQARTSWLFDMVEELDTISRTDIEGETKEEIMKNTAKVRNRLDVLKFALGKLAPRISSAFEQTSNINITDNSPPKAYDRDWETGEDLFCG